MQEAAVNDGGNNVSTTSLTIDDESPAKKSFSWVGHLLESFAERHGAHLPWSEQVLLLECAFLFAKTWLERSSLKSNKAWLNGHQKSNDMSTGSNHGSNWFSDMGRSDAERLIAQDWFLRMVQLCLGPACENQDVWSLFQGMQVSRGQLRDILLDAQQESLRTSRRCEWADFEEAFRMAILHLDLSLPQTRDALDVLVDHAWDRCSTRSKYRQSAVQESIRELICNHSERYQQLSAPTRRKYVLRIGGLFHRYRILLLSRDCLEWEVTPFPHF